MVHALEFLVVAGSGRRPRAGGGLPPGPPLRAPPLALRRGHVATRGLLASVAFVSAGRERFTDGATPRASSAAAQRPGCAAACGSPSRTRRPRWRTPRPTTRPWPSCPRSAARSAASRASSTGCCASSAACRRTRPDRRGAPAGGRGHRRRRDVQAAALRAGSDATEPQVRSLVRQARDEVDIVSAALSRHALVGPAPLRIAGRSPAARRSACQAERMPTAPSTHRAPSRRDGQPARAKASWSAWRRRATRSRVVSTATDEPHNNWSGWEDIGRVERSGMACDFWRHPEEALDRAAAIGCNAFRLSVEWARLEPRPGTLRRRRARALRRDPLAVQRPGSRARRHAAPLHPPVVAGRGVLAASGIARRLRPPRGARPAGAGAVLPALGDDQRAQHRDADGLDRGRRPAGPAHGGGGRLLRARQSPHRARAGGRRRHQHPARGRGHDEHELVVDLRARPHAARPVAAARRRRGPLRRRPLRRRAPRHPRRRLPAAARRARRSSAASSPPCRPTARCASAAAGPVGPACAA